MSTFFSQTPIERMLSGDVTISQKESFAKKKSVDFYNWMISHERKFMNISSAYDIFKAETDPPLLKFPPPNKK